MGDILFKTYIPNKFLQPYISKIWVFESKYGTLKNDLNLIAPNGEIKMIISYKNNMRSTIDKYTREHKESQCFIIGLHTISGTMEWDSNYGSIGIEFKPFAAYKFFDFPLHKIANQIYDAPDILNKVGIELQEKVAEIADIDKKVLMVEEFLTNQLKTLEKCDPIVDYAINRIILCSGLVKIGDLSEETGYSKRHLTRRFTETIGLSPKEFAGITRFHNIFKKLTIKHTEKESFYDLYYDNSHFIKNFKKVTTLTPGEYINQSNKFGGVFYG